MKRLLIVLAFVLISACSFGSTTTIVASPVVSPSPIYNGEKCANLFVEAIVSQVPVPGSFNCQDSKTQLAANGAGVTDDQSLNDYLSQLGWVKSQLVFASPGIFVYELTGNNSTDHGILVIYTNSDGLIDRFGQSVEPSS